MVMREIVKARKEIPRGGMKNLQYKKKEKIDLQVEKRDGTIFRREVRKEYKKDYYTVLDVR
jgi:hypothetical protein